MGHHVDLARRWKITGSVAERWPGLFALAPRSEVFILARWWPRFGGSLGAILAQGRKWATNLARLRSNAGYFHSENDGGSQRAASTLHMLAQLFEPLNIPKRFCHTGLLTQHGAHGSRLAGRRGLAGI